MTRSDRDSIIYSLVGLVLIFGTLMLLSWVSCHAKWSDFGYPVKYAPFAGCRLQLTDGRWVPAASVRELDLPAPAAKGGK